MNVCLFDSNKAGGSIRVVLCIQNLAEEGD